MKRLWFLIRVISFVFLGASVWLRAATEPVVMQAKIWDATMTLGAGGFRGKNPVKSEGKLNHAVEPGAFIEELRVDGGRDVHWKIEGAYLKNCSFSGDLGFHFSAKDSALENCSLSKSGSMFVGWAGTKWRFENCLITASFVHDGGLHDYAAYASDCTFVGIRMAAHGLRDDPSKYAGKAENGYIRCRFIGCEIPETVLALSVDCIFENCKFTHKPFKAGREKDLWEKAASPVNVTASVAGGSVPPEHRHGQLSVKFASAGSGQTAGCTLPFTHAGTRVVVPWVRQISKIHAVGSLDKKASEIPVFASSTESEKPAPAPVPPPPDAASGKELRTFEELLTAVPLGFKLVTAGKVNPAALDELNKALDQRAGGRPAVFRMTVDEIAGYKDEGYAFLAKSQAATTRIAGESCAAFVHARFRASHSAALSKLSKGSSVTVKGTVSSVSVSSVNRALRLVITLDEAQGL